MTASDSEATSDSIYFPSKTWFDTYRQRINEDERHSELSEGWADGFNGDFIFELTDIPFESMDESAMPSSLRAQLNECVSDTETSGYVARAFIGFDGTNCTEASLVTDDTVPEHGFYLSASIDVWKELMRGETDIIQGLLGGAFTLDGDTQIVMRFSGSAVRLTELAGEIKTEFADETF